ncbi:DUF4115 domain-containing protein [Alteribacter natronophilus]|uniref:DUF4115 domain-containing protein n=1 Tax=Alteribacter natronophilus TaxID=2583810 RepID=UPI00110E519D|nr:DUF4115 domain-containing protein [Alteribacter natronophilus]TMW72233.1 hypothetical protein FGB90_08455 [Alteribacter natronophilus]
MKKAVTSLYPVALLTIIVLVLAGLRHETTLSKAEEGDLAYAFENLEHVAAEAEVEEEVLAGEAEIEEVTAENETTTFAYRGDDDVTTLIKADGEEMWLEVSVPDTGEILYSGIIPADGEEEIDLSGYGEVDFRIGNPDVLAMEINGMLVNTAHNPSHDLSVILSAEGDQHQTSYNRN